MEPVSDDVRTHEPQTTGGPDLLGAGMVVLAALQFGTVVVVGKVASEWDLAVGWILALRFAAAALILVVALAVLRRPILAARGERSWLVLLGAAGYGIEASLFFLALEHGNASIVTLLFFTYPAMVALASIALGRGSPGWMLGGALSCAVVGAGLVVASSGSLDIDGLGILFSLSAAAVFTLYLMGADSLLKKTDPMTSAAWVSGSAALGLTLFSVVTGDAVAPSGFDEWGPILWMALVTAGAFVCLLAGLRRLGPVRSSIIASLEPAAGAILSVVFLHEPYTALMIMGGGLILLGAAAAALARRPTSETVPFEPAAP
jgi:drug/metabolite transporter (DMT)-like permease